MTLGQFAVTVGAEKRWVQNALRVLGVREPYSFDLARRLAFAKLLKDGFGISLVRGFPLAGDAIAAWPGTRTWEYEGPEGMGKIVVNVERFLSDCTVRLSLSRTFYAEKPRGRPPKRRRRGLALAKWYGVDISLLEESLKLTPADRLKRLDENVEFLRRMRVVAS